MTEETTYIQKLRNPLWQRKRLEIFNRDNFTCQSCNSTITTLHIHHLKYFPGLEPWEYDNKFLVTYCEICHNTEHLIGGTIHESLLELINQFPIYIKPLSQLCILIEKDEGFYSDLKEFLNNKLIDYLDENK